MTSGSETQSWAHPHQGFAFTLIELLVVIAIMWTRTALPLRTAQNRA